jgi:hypothetical protein
VRRWVYGAFLGGNFGSIFEVDFGPFFCPILDPFFARFGTRDLHVYTGLVAPEDSF